MQIITKRHLYIFQIQSSQSDHVSDTTTLTVLSLTHICLLYWAQWNLQFLCLEHLISRVLNTFDCHWALRERETAPHGIMPGTKSNNIKKTAKLHKPPSQAEQCRWVGFLIQSLLPGLEVCSELPSCSSAVTPISLAWPISVWIKPKAESSLSSCFVPLTSPFYLHNTLWRVFTERMRERLSHRMENLKKEDQEFQ